MITNPCGTNTYCIDEAGSVQCFCVDGYVEATAGDASGTGCVGTKKTS